MAEYDAAFAALSRQLHRKIDYAFDQAAGVSSSRAPRAASTPSSLPGGFLVDDDAAEPGGFLLDHPAGGFLPPSPPAIGGFVAASPPPTRTAELSPDDLIPLSEIPHALQLLDLSPSDEEILSVFRNAASGWSQRSQRNPTAGESEEFVSRKDWRAVCSALLNDDGDDEQEDEDEVPGEEDLDADPMDVDESVGDGSSDEYVEETTPKKKKRGQASSKTPARKTRARKAKDIASESDDDDPDISSRPLTDRQKRECLSAFSLFFPGVSEETVARRRIGVKELTKAADLLKERIKLEEMMEMLEAFSSTPDKTMGLSDFEKMMVTTRLA